METGHLRNLTMGQAEHLYHEGRITSDQWEAFMHAWATTAPRFGVGLTWMRHEFPTPEAEAIARELGCCSYRP